MEQSGHESELMRLLWVIDFDYATRNHHGAILRYVNYATELMRLGHAIYFAAELDPRYREGSRSWFQELIDQGVIKNWIELTYVPTVRRGGVLTLIPALSNLVQRKSQHSLANAVIEFARRETIDSVIVSNRRLLFLADRLAGRLKVITDFGDCMTLYYLRSVKTAARQGSARAVARLMKPLAQSAAQEWYYGRNSTKSIVVSPVDKAALDRMTGRPERSVIPLNGVRIPGTAGVTKVPGQIIFTGNMSFPPNHEAAMWFLDFVFPLIQREHPQARLVLAGADPKPELRRRATERILVTGFVEDLNQEIARSSLFVAPLISGGGFKYKVVEALANRTYIVASPFAVEFLEPEIRDLIAVEANPARMAAVIVELLRDPSRFAGRLEQLHAFVRDRMSWSGRTFELVELLESMRCS
jgi:glycosyltransferase involved in cell wall biosynthesis